MWSVARLALRRRAAPRTCSLAACQAQSVSTSTSELACEIMSFHGPRKFGERRWLDLNSYLERYPMLFEVPKDRLVDTIDPKKPYLTTESGRCLIRSGILLPYISHERGQSVPGTFCNENVGILKGLGVFVFRHINSGELNVESVHTDYLELSKFLKELIVKQHGDWALDHLPVDLANLFDLMEEKLPRDELILDHGSLLPDNERARAQFEIHRLLRKELPARGQGNKALRIMESLPYVKTWKTIATTHPLLNGWMGEHKQKAAKLKRPQPASTANLHQGQILATPQNPPDGCGLVDVNRHGVVHAVESQTVVLINQLSTGVSKSLKDKPYTLKDVIQLYHYKFPMFLPIALQVFKKESFVHKFGLRQRFKIPSLYRSYFSEVATESAHRFALSEIEDATDKFEKRIGSGGFGIVYYGKLADGREIAVKLLTNDSYQGIREFLNEVTLLSRIHHRNLVTFLGYSQQYGKNILVYELRNGTLKEHLRGGPSDDKITSWVKRLEIAEDAAKGIEYLHTGCSPTIIHRDLKSSNILLDKNMRAKVADFGLSKSVVDGSHVSSIVRRTVGYLDPEYYISQQLTEKSDIYSFGVILLELISGHEPIYL